MATIKYCRICLQFNVKVFIMHSNSLELWYEILTGNNVKKLGLSRYACYECAALLKKFYIFRQTGLQSQSILENILSSCTEVTDEDIIQIDRKSLLLGTNLSVSDIQVKYSDGNSTYTDDKIENNVLIDEQDFDWPSDEELQKFKTEIEVPIKDQIKQDDPIALKDKKRKKTKIPKLKIKKKVIEKKEKKTDAVKKRKPATVDCIDSECFAKHFATIHLTTEEQFEEVRRRQESKNYRNSFYKCEICYKGFIHTKAWETHNKQHQEGKVQCDICKMRFRTKHSLQVHIQFHSTKYRCRHCPYLTLGKNHAKLHILWHRGHTYICDHCGEKFSNRNAYLTHVRLKHRSDWVCGFCASTFVSQLGLMQHKSYHHASHDEKMEIDENPDAPHCAECKMKFANMEAFKKHFLTARKHEETAQKTIGCRECGETFASKEERRQHAHVHQSKYAGGYRPSAPPLPARYPRLKADAPETDNGPTVWPNKCPLCSEMIASARSLSAHFRTAHPHDEYVKEKPHVCHVCGSRLQTKYSLEAHMLSHLKEKPFKCGQCGRGFNSAGCRASHENTVHSDLRPHQCSLCHRAFKKKATLKAHFMTHTGEKPYRCEICGHAFTQSNSCKSHIRKVHGEQPPRILTRTRHTY